jgi:hypothetical protein
MSYSYLSPSADKLSFSESTYLMLSNLRSTGVLEVLTSEAVESKFEGVFNVNEKVSISKSMREQ